MLDILFVNSVEKMDLNQEVNGTLILGTKLLEAGFNVDILRFCQIDSYHKDYLTFINDITKKILDMAPQCVSFYTLWPSYHIILRIASRLKEERPEIITVLGGPQSSASAYSTLNAMSFIDYISTGEGESTVVPFFTEILRDRTQNLESIPGLYFRKNGIIQKSELQPPLCDLNSIPHWDDRLYIKHYNPSDPRFSTDNYSMPIDAGRGCPYNCTFCCTSYFWKRTYRLKSPERIVEDIRFYNKKFGIRSFGFAHDAFTINHELVSKVCDHILDSGLDIRWKCASRIDCITEELILKMKEAGLFQIELGIETGSPRMQKLINKNLNLEKAKQMISFLLKNNIRVCLFFIYGFPEETEEELRATLDLIFPFIDMGVNQIDLSYCRFYPTTALTEKYIDELVFDPTINILYRDVFGYTEEIAMIKENKEIFPFYYHLNTTVRNKYQYLHLFVPFYMQYHNTLKYVRNKYYTDSLQFYLDFYSKNLDCFNQGIDHVMNVLKTDSIPLLNNMIKGFEISAPIYALAKYEQNCWKVAKMDEGSEILDSYDFSYYDYALRLPLENYSKGTSEILLRKINGTVKIKVLSVK